VRSGYREILPYIPMLLARDLLMEHEGRLFGNMEELEKDVVRYLDIAESFDYIKPRMTMDFGTHKVQWVLIESHHDFQKIMGLQFSQIMFDVSFPHDCLSYCLSRLRAPSRHAN
jgi:hypothetical protein